MRIKKGVVIQKMGNVFVALDNENGALHELNATGFLILESIQKKLDKKNIIQKLTQEFSVDKKVATRDYEDFIKLLRKKDLIALK